MNIYIKVEVETRELLSRLLLGMYAVTNDHEVLIGNDELLRLVEQNKLKPGIILEKSITPSNSRIHQLENYKKYGSKITSIDEEGVIKDNYDVLLNSRFSKKTVSLADKVFCWGKYDYESLVRLFPEQKNKFVVTGNPRVSLWGDKYKKLFFSNSIKDKKYILISANFSIGVSIQRLSQMAKFNLDNNYFKDPKFIENFYNRMSLNLKLLFKFISAIDNLTKKFKDFNFIIRPHPSESVDQWQKFFTKKNNLEITKKFTHSDWIENSEIIIHHGCTAGVEAFVRKKKIISYEPLDTKTQHTYPNIFGYTAKNETELENLIKKIYEDKSVEEPSSENLKELIYRFGNMEIENFATNITNEWSKLDDKTLSQKNNLFSFILKNKLRLIRNKFIKPYINEKFPPLDKEKIVKFVNQIKKTDEKLNKVNVDIVGPYLIKLSLVKK